MIYIFNVYSNLIQNDFFYSYRGSTLFCAGSHYKTVKIISRM